MKRYLLNNGIQPLAYARTNPPFFFRGKQGRQPQLLSRHFVYLLIKDSGQRSFYAREVLNEEDISDVLAIDKLNFRLLEQAMLSRKAYTSQTQSHQKRRSGRQMCPLCPGFLTGQKSKKGKIRDGKEYFEVKCHYRHYPDYSCEFFIELERPEYILFKRNRYPTSRWLNMLPTKRCPLCKDLLFERKSLDGKVFHQCRKTLIRQVPGEDHCDYRIEIDQ